MSNAVLQIALTDSNLQETLANIRHSNASVVVSDSPAALSGKLIAALRSEGNHIPVVSLVNANEELPEAILENCCGPKFLRTDSAEDLRSVIASMLTHVHAEHC
jgi:hypothetical protein